MVRTNLIKAKMAQYNKTNFVGDLAEVLGVSDLSASNKFKGIYPWKLVDIKKFARAFNLDGQTIIQIWFPEFSVR